MKLSFKFKPSISKKQLEIIEELSYHTTKLYNIINYDLRENGVKTYYDIEKNYKLNWHCDFLHSHTRQHCFKVLEQNWNELQQVRIKWDNSLKQWYLIVIYNRQELEPVNNTNIMAIDLGLDNLAALTFKDGNETYLFCGKKLKGINAEESYTSGCSALDLEPIDKKHYDKTRRIVRGLFKSSFGLVNSDVNGSLNILRKEEKCIPKIVQTVRDKGSVSSPLRVRVAC